MKIKALAALCKASKRICVYDRKQGEKVEQWIGDGTGLYPITGLPYLDEDGVCYLFDVPQDKRSDWMITHEAMPAGFDVEDNVNAEQQLELPEDGIKTGGRMYIPFNTSAGTKLVDRANFAPISDVANQMTFFERRTPEGGVYIACKVGFLLHAVIIPALAVDEAFARRMEILAQRCRYACQLTQLRFRSVDATAQRINPDTGEIVDDDDIENGMTVEGRT